MEQADARTGFQPRVTGMISERFVAQLLAVVTIAAFVAITALTVVKATGRPSWTQPASPHSIAETHG